MVRRKKCQISWRILLVFFLLVLSIFSVCFFDDLSSANTFTDATQTDFDGGTYNNTFYNTTGGFVQLIANDTAQELPNNQEVETFYGGINMTGNVLLMHFNNDSNYEENNTHVYDFSGKGNNGIFSVAADADSGPTTSGKLNGAFEFDGNGDYVNAGFNWADLNSGGTVSLWIRLDVVGSYILIASQGTGNNYVYIRSSDSTIFFQVGGTQYSKTLSQSIDTWYYITVTKNSGSTGEIFVDGASLGTGTVGSAFTSSNFRIGAWNDASLGVNGIIDEVAIWNRSLSATEILEIYNRQKGNYIAKGEYASQIFDAGSNATWNNISWTQGGPYQQELPNNQSVESTWLSGNANMTGNVLLMHLNEGSGNPQDSSGEGNHGTNYAATWTTGKFGGGIACDSNDYIDVSVDIGSTWTIETWFYYPLEDYTHYRTLTRGSSDDHQVIVETGTYNLGMFDNAGGGGFRDTGYDVDVLSTGWHHLVAVGYDSQQDFYIDGGYVGQTDTKSTTDIKSIGNYWGGGQSWGTIDEFAVYNRALSADEILAHYKRGALRLNLSVQNCSSSDCSDGTWQDVNDTSPQDLNLTSRYFQYKFEFETDNGSYSPKLYNVTINYDIIPTLDHYYVHTYDNATNLPRSYFANQTQIQVRTNGTFATAPTITITDSNGTIHVNEQIMTNQTGEYYYYNYTLNGSQGWYDVTINSQNWEDVFYQGEVWQGNYTDADGNPFSFRRRINVTEPGNRTRWFEPIDIQVNFTYEPNNNSVRVLAYNGTHMLEIPSQIYNQNQTAGSLYSANLVFLSTINKSETREYYVVTTKTNLPKSYTTDLTYSNNSNQYTIANSYFTSMFNTSTGGLMQDVIDKIGTNTSLSGIEPMDYYPQFEIGLTTLSSRSDTSVNVDTVAGPILYRFNVSGQANDDSSKPYTLSHRIYSKNKYMVCEKNQSTTATQNWKNLEINGLIFEDGSFTNVSYRNSSDDITTRALAAGDNSDSTSLDSNMKWIAFYDTSLGDAVAELFLDKSFATTNNPSMSISDESAYEYYRHLIIDSTQTQVSSGSSFYTKTARMIYNGLQEYSIVNETYENLLNPLTTQQSSEETSDSENPSYSGTGNTSSDDQNNATCYSYWTDDSFLDYAAINITGPGGNGSTTVLYQNTSYTIRSSSSFTNRSWVNKSLNSSVLNAGQINCNITVYDVAGRSNSTVIQFNVSDNTSPCFDSVNNVPGTNADLDPTIQVNITANFTEYSNVSAVVLQYRNSSQSEWTNTSMNLSWNNSYNYNYSANFTPTTENVWQYRIYANDTSGNSNYSDITNLSVYYDWTWEHSLASFGIVSGLLATNITLGNIRINNTGDMSLSFKITSNWDDKDQIFFNDTAEGYSGFSFNLSSGDSTNVSVNITAKSTERSDDLTITINALNISASPDDNTSTATIVSYASGPFLLVTITQYPSSVTQEETGIALTAQVQNKGNETATNPWLAWNLPSGWTVTSGSLNNTVENLLVDEIAYNLVIVSIGSSASTGSKTLTASAGCSENKTGSDSVSVVVIAKSNGGNGGGGGPGGGYTTQQVTTIIETIIRGEKTLSSLEAFEIVRGYNDSFPVTVKNILVENANLYNVSMSVTGYLSQYLQVSPEMFDEILYNETKEFNVTIISPTYMKKGTYQLNISITGEIIGHLLEMNLTDNRFVTLVIHEVSKEEANSSIVEASWFIDDLSNVGFKTTKISRVLKSALEALEDHDYESAKELCDGIETMKENAFLAYDLINQIKNSIENNPSRSLNETQAILNLGYSCL